MTDSRFFTRKGPFTISYLQSYVGGRLDQCDNPDKQISDIAPLDQAGSDTVSCYHNTKYKDTLTATETGVCLIHEKYLDHAPTNLPLIITAQPYRAYAKIASLFYPEELPTHHISPQAFVSPHAKIGKNCYIAPFVYIGDDAEIGDNTVLESHVSIERGVVIGNNCRIRSHVSITHALVGHNVHIKPGARIGQRGFGFDISPDGVLDVPQLGRVVIHDNVEIGANTTIDRGANHDTVIGKGCRIDNLVQIGHNVTLGDHCILVAQVGIAGSTKLGKFVIAAGQAGITGHLTIGDSAKIGAQAGVMRNIPSGEAVGGSPAVSAKDFLRQAVALSRLIKKEEKKS